MKNKSYSKLKSRKFLLMTALFIMSQIWIATSKITPFYWFLGSATGTFGFIVIRAWLDIKKKDIPGEE